MGFLFGYRGRFSRLEWWSVQLLAILAYFGMIKYLAVTTGFNLSDAASVEDGSAFSNVSGATVFIMIAFVFVIAWMTITASIKRYHDRNKPGWWYLICIIPLVGPIWQLVELGFLRGTDGNNDYDVLDGAKKSTPKANATYASASNAPIAIVPARRIEAATGRPVFGNRRA